MSAAPLILVIPGLSLPAQMLHDLSFDLHLPGLSRLLSEGALDSADLSADVQPLFQALLRPDQIAPAAPLRLLGLGHPPAQDHWLCLDPVSLHFRERSVVVRDPSSLALEIGEAQALLETVSPVFSEFGELSCTEPRYWHLRMNTPPPEFPSLPAAVSSQSNVGLCPDRNWRRALNEAQMLLHTHPVNLARNRRGQIVVNSLWPWGGGCLTSAAPEASAMPVLHTDDALLRGFAHWTGARVTAAPGRFSDALLIQPEICLIDLTALRLPAQSGDAMGWRDALAGLDRDWFEPLLSARDGGQLRRKIHVVFPGRESARRLSLPAPGLASGFRRLWGALRKRPNSGSLDQLAEPL
ncbi:MAG: hypothetical protein IPH08_09090 [Rhodocyclaceae bacterium]|nr:hypothetical protein [Rhodocyclaceae bacterium]